MVSTGFQHKCSLFRFKLIIPNEWCLCSDTSVNLKYSNSVMRFRDLESLVKKYSIANYRVVLQWLGGRTLSSRLRDGYCEAMAIVIDEVVQRAWRRKFVRASFAC